MSGIVGKNLGRGSGLVKVGAVGADSVTGASIADDAIDSEHYTDGSIDNAHIADDAIDSEHYADGSIDNAHIADDAIDSEHYAAGSIDEAHIADNAVTLAKMAGGTDGNIISFDTSGNPVAVATGTDGQVLTSSGAGAVCAFEDAAGGGGKIGQCIQAYKTDTTSTTSSSFADISGITQAITPSATSSKILIMVNLYVSNTSSNTWFTNLDRGGTSIGGDDAGDFMDAGGANGSGYNRNRASTFYIDSPSTTSATTYKAQWKCDGNTLYLNRVGSASSRGGASSITLWEILA